MRYYPVCLDVKDKPCVVVGGGSVGARKARTLLACGAKVTIVDPDPKKAVREMAVENHIQLKIKSFDMEDLNGCFLVIGATDNLCLNRKVHEAASKKNMLCNIADTPELCNFILPSVVEKGDLVISISTSGKSPAFAKRLRKDLEKQFGEEHARLLRLMGAIRKRLLAESHAPEEHKPLFEAVLDSPILELLAGGDEKSVDVLLKEVFGNRFNYDELKSEIKENPGNLTGPGI
jgi:precorrin-2 dehydrogenase/sirohydrochlorin ferrochelatase